MANDWTLHDVAPIAQGFERPAAAWSLVHWGGVATMAFEPQVPGGSTRGLPFGHRGAAFNGGRTFRGPLLAREQMRAA